MVGGQFPVGDATAGEQGAFANGGQDTYVLGSEVAQQIGANENLVRHVPEIADGLVTLEVEGAAGIGMVAEVVPHGIVEILAFLLLYSAGGTNGNSATHDGIEAAVGGDHTRLEGIHVEITEQDGALMTLLALDIVDHAGQDDGFEDLAVVGKSKFAGQMGGGEEDGLMAGKSEAADGDAMALQAQGEQAGVEAGEEEQVLADAGGELIVGRFRR